MVVYSFLDLASEVLAKSPKPLTYQEIWESGTMEGLTLKIQSKGKTPWNTLGAQLYVEVRDNKRSKFIKVGRRPARFFLKARQSEVSLEAVAKLEIEAEKNPQQTKLEKKSDYHERDLHPLVAYFASAYPSFNRGRSIYTKTIFHEQSLKAGYNEWIHPDVVGFYLPLEDWHQNVVEFNRVSDHNALRLFSFEIKKALNKANYRESYFQAVSNSSWAHEGYLVAVDVLQDDDFLAELERLAGSFGIGIIQLNPADMGSSRVLYPARPRASLDWETINKLCQQNVDFAHFLRDVRIDFDSKLVHPSQYDNVRDDMTKYIKDKLKIDQESGL